MVQEPCEIIDLNEEAQEETEDIPMLKYHFNNLRYQDTLYGGGVIPLTTQNKFIKHLRDKWAEELMFQKFRCEELQEEIRDLKKFKSMQKEKEHMYTLSQELLSCRGPSPSYSIFLYEQMPLLS